MTNKEQFEEELRGVSREGVEELLVYLANTDFYEAPASTIYHNNHKGGLCEHSLNVLKNIRIVNTAFNLELDAESMVLVALLHDLAKTDFYELTIQNRKSYNPNGRSSDTMGKFDWVQVESYRVKESTAREHVFGEHGLCSFMVANKFLKLTDDESAAIINHHMDLDNGKIRTDISECMNRYPLLTALCLADTSATYLDENPYKV